MEIIGVAIVGVLSLSAFFSGYQWWWSMRDRRDHEGHLRRENDMMERIMAIPEQQKKTADEASAWRVGHDDFHARQMLSFEEHNKMDREHRAWHKGQTVVPSEDKRMD